MNSPLEQNADEPHGPSLSDRLMSDAGQTYRTIKGKLAVRSGDPLWLIAGKLLLKLVAICLMILLSPLVLFGLIFAFMAVL